VRAGGRSNAARFAVSQAWSGGGITPSGSSSDQELVDLVQVLRLPERVTNQSRAVIRALTVEMICQVPDPVAPADLVRPYSRTSS
jgi:hypothetical protein